jgi:hypothetical protein
MPTIRAEENKRSESDKPMVTKQMEKVLPRWPSPSAGRFALDCYGKVDGLYDSVEQKGEVKDSATSYFGTRQVPDLAGEPALTVGSGNPTGKEIYSPSSDFLDLGKSALYIICC